MSDAPPKKKPALKVNVLKCRSESCAALLAYEETNEGLLLGNMYDLASRDGDLAYFPCPKCGGRNVVVEVEHGGRIRTKVTGFQSAP